MNDKKPKSQSKKIRDIIFRIWESEGSKGNFEQYYKTRTDLIIAELMAELEPPLPTEQRELLPEMEKI